MNNVIEMVSAGTCTGCSRCVLFYPFNNLTMQNEALGFPVPHAKNEELCKGCNECIKVCPFSDEYDKYDENE